MNEKTIKVGLVIADIDEYIHVENQLENIGTKQEFATLLGHTALIKGENSDIKLTSVCSGIGKVNAAAAAAIIAKDCDIIINAGLSGGFDNDKFGLVLGTLFYEHDFDLTAIGYKKSVKPGNEGILSADTKLNNDILSKFPFVKSGVFVTGDSFICSERVHNELKSAFNPIACDMESAAIAHVAKLYNIPYVSVRMISDGANNDSADTYTATLKGEGANGWSDLVFSWLKTL
jgi:adenosylhomocysteine nucleosidase